MELLLIALLLMTFALLFTLLGAGDMLLPPADSVGGGLVLPALDVVV